MSSTVFNLDHIADSRCLRLLANRQGQCCRSPNIGMRRGAMGFVPKAEEVSNRATPIVAAILLLLPVLYVMSHFALVVPEGRFFPSTNKVRWDVAYYRLDSKLCALAYWPLEQIDRKVRPGTWGP